MITDKRKYRFAWMGMAMFLALQGSLQAQSIEFLTAIRNGEFRRIVTMGTSLTAIPGWPNQLQTWLKEQTIDPLNVSLWNRGVGAAASDSDLFDSVGYEHLSGKRWALPLIKATLPVADVIFIEYAINDAYLPYDVSLQDSEDNLNFIIDDLLVYNPDIEIILMAMNNPAGPHLISRPNIEAYYEIPRNIAAERNLLLIDHYPNWISLFNADPVTWNTYLYDELHPNPLGAETIIIPEMIRALEAASLPSEKKIPVITWDAPAAITYGTALSGSELNASADVPGTLSYSPASGTALGAGIHTLSATFSPTDPETYATITETVILIVNKETPTVTWDTPTAIIYGTPLGGIQLNAETSGTGTLTYAPPVGTVLDAGTEQQLQVSLPESANYASASAMVEIDVMPAPLAITADNQSRAAGAANPALTASYSGLVNGDAAIDVSPTLSTTADSLSAPGDYPITVTGADDTNYDITQVDGILTVADKEIPVITWNDPVAITFGTEIDGTQLSATASVVGTFSYVPPSGTILDAGIQTLTANFAPTDNVTFADVSKSVTITVDKASPPLVWNAPLPISYGTPLSATQLSAITAVPGTLAFDPPIGTVLNAGTAQSLLVSLPESTNYLAGSTSVAIDVTSAPLTITADDEQRAAGAANPTLTATFAGFVNGDNAIATPPTLSTLADSLSAPGAYPITVTGGGDPNYTLSHANGTLTVADKAEPVISWGDPATITFGTALDGTQLNATASEAGAFSYVPVSGTMLDAGMHTLTATFTPTDTAAFVSVSKSVTISVDKVTPTITWSAPAAITYGAALNGTQLNATTAAPGALSYTPASGTIPGVGTAQQLAVALPESANYLAGAATVDIDVTPAPLTITADDKQRGFGLANPPLTATYSGFVNGETAISTLPTLSTTADGLSPAGTYPITVTGGSDPSYTITQVDGTLTVTAQQVPVITWSAPAAITFGTALDGTQLNATADTAGAFVYTPASATVLNAGSHSITAIFTPADTVTYSTAIETVMITVNKATPTITWSAPADMNYGTALDGTQLNATTGDPGTLFYTPAAGAVLDAGAAQQLQVDLPESANYSAATATVAINVLAAPLTITADDKQRGAGAANPTLTATYSGLVNGDATITTLPTLSTTADNASAPGSYPITALGGSDSNYTITHVDGALTVAEKEVPVISWSDPASITYGTQLDAAQLNAVASVPGTFEYDPESGDVLSAGIRTLTVEFTPADGDTYANASGAVTLVVDKATPVINWSAPGAITYGTALNGTQLNAATTAPGVLVYAPATGTVLDSGVGQPLQVSLPESDNFEAASEMFTIDVTPAPLTIAADDKQRGAGQGNPTLTATFTGLVNGDATIGTLPTLSTTADNMSAPGDYPITVADGSDPNYTITHIEGTFTVADKEVPMITWGDPAAITFGTALDGVQLNASAAEAGTFSYTPASGTVLDAGIHTLTATFDPTDTVTYASASKAVTVTVDKATPVITWSEPAAITYGTALDGTQLNAANLAPGTLDYVPALGTILAAGTAQQLQVSLPESANYTTAAANVTIDVTPAPLTIVADDKQRGAGLSNPPLTASYIGIVNGDTAIATPPVISTDAVPSSDPGFYAIRVASGADPNYTIIRKNGTLAIAQREVPAITWSDPLAITFGEALDGTQLNATADVPGTFVYSPADGAVLDAGERTLSATFTPTDAGRYAIVSASVAIEVNKATPTITWNPPVAVNYGTALGAAQLNATTVAPGTLAYAPAAGIVLGVGVDLPLNVSLEESDNYLAGSAMVTIDVLAVPLTITADDKQRGAGLSNPELTANYTGFVNGDTTIDTLPVISTTAEIASAPGDYPITVTGGSDPNYTITRVNGILTVEQKEIPEITWTDPAAITFGAALGESQLNATANVPGSFTYAPVSGTVLSAGAHTLTATFESAESARYASVSKTVIITVDKVTPAITWEEPAEIVFGAPLSATQLNASVDAVGVITYTPAIGHELAAGEQALMAEFIPTDTENFTGASKQVPIIVDRATPVITWVDPDDISFGTALDEAQLNAVADVAGSFTYTPPAEQVLDAGLQTLEAEFTPADTANYRSATMTVVITVNKAIPILTWTPASLTYGAPLSGGQLNAEADQPGTFTYTPALGAVLDAGNPALSVEFTPTDSTNYSVASNTVLLTVNRAVPVITWENSSGITYGSALGSIQLNAATTAPGTFVYTPASGTVLDAGSAQQLQVALPESTNFSAASASVLIDVAQAPLIVTADDKQRLAGFDNPTLTVSYTGFVNGDTAIGTEPVLTTTAVKSSAPGSYPITATGGADPNYSISYVNGSLTVSDKEIPVITWSNPAAITFGRALDGNQLNATANVEGAIEYAPATGTELNAGTHTLTATFSPTDTARYAIATKTVTIVVNKATPTLTWDNPTAIVYGTGLSSAQLNAAADAPGTLVYTPGLGTVPNVGTAQQLRVVLPESSNYLSVNVAVSIDVTPAPLTITAENKVREAGVDNPTLTAIYSGFVNGDTAVAIPPTLTTTAVLASAPGNYPIAVTGGSDPNYSINYVNGTLTVSDKEVPTIIWSTPGPITSVTPLGEEQLNAAVSGVRGSFTYTPSTGTLLDAGSHVLSVEFTPLDTSRYASTSSTVTITVSLGVSPWQNQAIPEDVFADGVIDLRDLSVVVTLMDSLVKDNDTYPDAGFYPDVDDDREVTLFDVDAVARALPDDLLDSVLGEASLRSNERPRTERADVSVNGFSLSLSAGGGKIYDMQYAQGTKDSNALVWETVRSGISGQIEFEDNDPIRNARRQGFYRLVVQIGKSDFDNNGVLEHNDINLLTAALRRGDTDLQFDLTEDGAVDFQDLKFLIEDNTTFNTWLGDLNLDGKVDVTDVLAWLVEFRKQKANAFWSDGDFDGDGSTGNSDFAFLAANFGRQRATPPGPIGFPWQNSTLADDVNADGALTPSDMVVILHELDRRDQLSIAWGSPFPLPAPGTGNTPPPYIDVNGDGVFSPYDAVVLKDSLNQLAD